MTIKLCVIGLGAMGRNHVRVQSDLPGAKLVGASDPSEAARAAAAKSGLAVYDDYRRLFDTEKPDACIVSVPTEVHLPVALDALSRGIHVLVEKPIAPTVADAQKMIDAAKAANRVLMVGQIERFNPAVQELKRVVSAEVFGGRRSDDPHEDARRFFVSYFKQVAIVFGTAWNGRKYSIKSATALRAFVRVAPDVVKLLDQ